MSGGTEEPGCWVCNSAQNKAARAIMLRLGREPSFAELWARLDQAERDRDRMMNALQVIRDAIQRGKVNRHSLTLIHRALSRIQPHRPPVTPASNPPLQEKKHGHR